MNISYDYYATVFGGAEMSGVEFDSLSRRSELLLTLLLTRPAKTPAEKEAYDKAVCAQTEYLYVNGGDEFAAGAPEITGEALGSYSYTKGGKHTGGLYSELAVRILCDAGLYSKIL